MTNSITINAAFASNNSSERVSEIFTLKNLPSNSLIRWEASEDIVFEVRSDSDKEFKKTIKNNDVTTFIEGEDLYIANPTPSVTQNDGFIITASACLTCVEFNNIKKALDRMNKRAFLNSVASSKKIDEDDPHAQGSNFYVDKNGRKHFIVSYDTRKSGKGGYLVIFSEPMSDKVKPRIMEIECNNKSYNHPGSFQIVGDFLFLPVEDYRGSESGRKDGAEIHVYDLSPLADEYKMPKKIDFCTIENHRAGALGATDEWIAINDQTTLYLYRYKITNADGDDNSQLKFCMNFVTEWKIEKTQGIGLIKESLKTNENENCDTEEKKEIMYLLGLITIDDKDYIHPYKIINRPRVNDEGVTSDNIIIIGEASTMFYTEPGNGGTGKDSIHLKYGGGVYLSDNDTIICLGTGRAIRTDMKFNFNIFSNVDRVELDCALKNIHDSEPRASQNFSILKFSSKKCIFNVYDDKGNVITINKNSATKLVVRRDISKKEDEDCCDIVSGSEMTIAGNLDKTPLYIAHKDKSKVKSEDASFLRVVIEGVT